MSNYLTVRDYSLGTVQFEIVGHINRQKAVSVNDFY